MSAKEVPFRSMALLLKTVGRYNNTLQSKCSLNIARTFACAAYKNIIIEKKGEKQNVGLITLNRPKVLNALSIQLVNELIDAIKTMDKDESIGAIVITGNEKSFSSGDDIKEVLDMDLNYVKNNKIGFLQNFNEISKCKKPIIAAVNGYAFGGGCELAKLCDIIYAGETALFGQPEVKIGAIPGIGGTQRIARSCGKSKAMEICLSGDPVSAREVEKMGLISKVFPVDQTVNEAVKLGEKISSFSPLIVKLCKEAVNVAFETTLQQGIRFERAHYFGTFATADRKEGMSAFAEKRKPHFINE